VRVRQLRAVLEALLFSSGEPLSAERLAEITRVDVEQVRRVLMEYAEELADDARGILLVEVAGGYALRTKPSLAEYVGRLELPRVAPLSNAALETLAIIAYKQPVTRAEIEEIRGVRCDAALATLLARRLVREAGRKDAPGRPFLYVTTRQFLEYFGLRDLADLPPPEEFEAAAARDQVGTGEERE